MPTSECKQNECRGTFGYSITIPLPKDSSSKTQCDSGNYRGITVSPIISEIFELRLFQKFGSYLGSEEMQLGFKKGVGTNHAIYSLCKVAEYFTENDSTVSICSLDLTQAFDLLNQYVLFEKLLKKICLVQFVNNMKCWLAKSYTVVRRRGSCLCLNY